MSKLYKTLLLKHYRDPIGFGSVAEMPVTAHGANTSCGDHFTVGIACSEDRIQHVVIEGRGCAVSTASCSMMAEWVEGMEISRARQCVRYVLEGLDNGEELDPVLAGDAAILSELKRFPSRRVCASLCWKALGEALACLPSGSGKLL